MLLDEPTNHLDVAHEVRVARTACARCARDGGRAVVMALHDLTLAARYATHAVLLGGDSVEAGPAARAARRGAGCRRCTASALVAVAHRARHGVPARLAHPFAIARAPRRASRTAPRRRRRSAARTMQQVAVGDEEIAVAHGGNARPALPVVEPRRAPCRRRCRATITSGAAATTASTDTDGAGSVSAAKTLSPPHSAIASEMRWRAADRLQRLVPHLVEHAQIAGAPRVLRGAAPRAARAARGRGAAPTPRVPASAPSASMSRAMPAIDLRVADEDRRRRARAARRAAPAPCTATRRRGPAPARRCARGRARRRRRRAAARAPRGGQSLCATTPTTRAARARREQQSPWRAARGSRCAAPAARSVTTLPASSVARDGRARRSAAATASSAPSARRRRAHHGCQRTPANTVRAAGRVVGGELVVLVEHVVAAHEQRPALARTATRAVRLTMP